MTVKVLYYLHWQTACFTVWANGKQNLGLVDFFPESRLPFVVPFSEKRPGEPERGIKDGFEEWNTHFRSEHSEQENRTTFSDVPLLPKIFH